jgi:hypothetical protein
MQVFQNIHSSCLFYTACLRLSIHTTYLLVIEIQVLICRAPSFKSLRLISFYDRLTEAIMKFPLLEELELSLCPNVDDSGVFGVIDKACPQLKRFRLSKDVFRDFQASVHGKGDETLGIATMHELRSLQLFGNILTNKGLTAILENCCHLESLDIRHCFNVTMDDALRAKCARISALRLPNDSTDDYDFIVKEPHLGEFRVLSGYGSEYELGSDMVLSTSLAWMITATLRSFPLP